MIPGGVNELLLRSAAAGGATAGRSVRFNSADSAYLSRVFPSIATNQKVTFSAWVKRSKLGTDQSLLSTNRSNTTNIDFIASNALRIYTGDGAGTGSFDWTTTQLFRDVSAWYHIVVAWDTTQATATNRLKVYVNGQEVTSWSSQGTITQNMQLGFSSATPLIGNGIASGYGDFYLALVHFIDGQALTPSSFGETSATTGQWIAKTYSGTYGTNGFFLDFLDNSTAAALGYDAAGSNDWTVNNLSITAGSGNDSLRDHPTSAGTSTGAGGEVSGNYATLNPLISTSSTLSNGNLDYTSTGTYQSAYSTIGMSSGKWYFEGTCTQFATDALIGVGYAPFTTSTYVGGSATSWGYEGALGDLYTNSGGSSFGNTYTTNDIISVAFDADTGKLWFAKNGTWQASGNPANGTNPAVTLTTGRTYFFGVSAANTGKWSCNYGARAFAYTAPSGFSPLVDTLLPTPTIAKPNTVMDVLTWTGTGSTRTITTPGGFSPDLLWLKGRSDAYNHRLSDTVRGAGIVLYSDSSAAEGNESGTGITSFTSSGFTLGSSAAYNGNGSTFVGWTWDAGSSNATNTSGTITSTVRANISAGFSVVSYTGNATAGATVGHSLGVAPSMIVFKNRDAGTVNWLVYHASVGNTGGLVLNTTDAFTTNNNWLNSTNPSSTVFTLGVGQVANGSGEKIIAYCWAPVAGYSAFGSYTGNGSTNGPFVYTGFRPAYVLIKGSSSITSWNIVDKQRLGYNADNYRLFAESSSAENATGILDFTANGFKIRNTGGDYNDNAQTYIYACFAESPLAYARAR